MAFGALTLVIEARRNYNVSAKHHPFAYYGILENLTAEHLCSQRDWNFGFYIYSLLYLFSYAFLLCSSELVELIYQSEAAAHLIGATDSLGAETRDPFNLSGTEYGRPLFISAFIIAFYSIGATRNIELHIRTLAHRLAGVPRGVYQVLDRLHDPNFLAESKPPTGPLMDGFLERLSVMKKPNLQSADIEAILKYTTPHLHKTETRTAAAESTRKPWLIRLFSQSDPETVSGSRLDDDQPTGREQYIEDISKALRIIDLLRPTITGGQRATHFPLLGMDELSSISKQLQDAIGSPGDTSLPDERNLYTLHQEILKFENYDIASLERLKEKTIEVANSTRAVFAVYFICNSRTILNVERNSAIDRVRRIADRGFRIEQNAHVGSLLFATVLSIIAVYSMMTSYARYEAKEQPHHMAEEIEKQLKSTDPLHPLNYITCTPYYKSKAYMSGGSDDIKKRGTCEKAKNEALDKYVSNRRSDLFSRTLFINFSLLLMVAAVVQMAIFEREVRLDQSSWRRWSFRRIPYVRFMTASVLPTIAGVIALAAGYVLRQIYSSDFNITTSQIEFLFVTNWRFFIASMVPCFILCISVYILMDKHDTWHALITVLVSVLCGGLFYAAVWYVPGATSNTDGMLGYESSWSVLASNLNDMVESWINPSITWSWAPVFGKNTFWLNSYKLGNVLSLALLPMLFLVFFAVILETSENVSAKTARRAELKNRDRQRYRQWYSVRPKSSQPQADQPSLTGQKVSERATKQPDMSLTTTDGKNS